MSRRIGDWEFSAHALRDDRDGFNRGEITKEEAFVHPDNNIITRGLGDFDTAAVPDMVTCSIQPNDIVLLCSDGLCGYCNRQTIEKTIKDGQGHLKRCCNSLIGAALKAGAEDNITVVLASITEKKKRRFRWFPFITEKKNSYSKNI